MKDYYIQLAILAILVKMVKMAKMVKMVKTAKMVKLANMAKLAKMVKMAKKIQRASLQRIARREAKGIFDAAKNHASWRKYAARQDVQIRCATVAQRWVRRKRARASADAAKARAQARCVADMNEGDFPPDAHEKALKIQSLARRHQAMSRVEARRSAIRDVADWRREREEKAARCLEHERQVGGAPSP